MFLKDFLAYIQLQIDTNKLSGESRVYLGSNGDTFPLEPGNIEVTEMDDGENGVVRFVI